MNGNPDVKVKPTAPFRLATIPFVDPAKEFPTGNKQLLDQLGPEKFAKHIRDSKQVYFTDTTFRDGHQSLLATRVRTQDMLAVANGLRSRFLLCFRWRFGEVRHLMWPCVFYRNLLGSVYKNLGRPCLTCYSKCYLGDLTRWVTPLTQII